MSETFYLSLGATLLWLMVWWSSLIAHYHLLSYSCINLCTIWKISNDKILKNDSQYPLAIQVNNFLLLEGGSKTETDHDREEGWEISQGCFLYWHLWLKGYEKNLRDGVCLYVCMLRTEVALNIWCMLQAAVASIGSVCIQRPIKPHSHGKGVIVKDWGWQHCLYTYLSIPTHTGLDMNTLEAFSCAFFLPCLPFTQSVELSSSICHFLKCCHSSLSCLFVLCVSC